MFVFRSGDYMSITQLPIIAMPGKQKRGCCHKEGCDNDVSVLHVDRGKSAEAFCKYCVLESNNLRCCHRCTGWKTNDNLC